MAARCFAVMQSGDGRSSAGAWVGGGRSYDWSYERTPPAVEVGSALPDASEPAAIGEPALPCPDCQQRHIGGCMLTKRLERASPNSLPLI